MTAVGIVALTVLLPTIFLLHFLVRMLRTSSLTIRRGILYFLWALINFLPQFILFFAFGFSGVPFAHWLFLLIPVIIVTAVTGILAPLCALVGAVTNKTIGVRAMVIIAPVVVFLLLGLVIFIGVSGIINGNVPSTLGTG